MIEFEGKLSDMSGGVIHDVRGEYEWIDRLTPEPRISGILWTHPSDPHRLNDYRRPHWIGYDAFDIFGQSQFMGRACRLKIHGVGLSPVRLHGMRWQDVRFEAWSPPITDATIREIADALWTPIYDLLLEAGADDMAAVCRAACVALEGFPTDPAGPETKKPPPPITQWRRFHE